MLDPGEHGRALRFQPGPGRLDRLGGAGEGVVDGGAERSRRLLDPLARRSRAAFDPCDMGAEPLCRRSDRLVGLAAPRGEGGELAFERACLLMGAEPRLAHRSGNGARLLFGARQIVEQHADINPGSSAAASSACERLSSSALWRER